MLVVAVLCAILSLSHFSDANQNKKTVCRYIKEAPDTPGYGRYTPDDIPLEYCTDVIYKAFFFPDWIRGAYRVDPVEKPQFIEFLSSIRRRSSTTRIIASIYGLKEYAEYFSIMAEIPERRRSFVQAMVDLINEFSIQGIELDWEWPGQSGRFGGISSDRQYLIVLLGDLQRAFKSQTRNGELWFFGAVYPNFFRESYRVSDICDLVDYVPLFTFDLRSKEDNVTDIPAPMRNRSQESGMRTKTNVIDGVQTWIDYGCPPRKLLLGIGLFARSFTLADQRQYGLFSPALGLGAKGQYIGQGYYPYHETCLLIRQGWNVYYDSVGQMPYAFRGNQWIGYEDLTSIRYKVDLVEEKKLGGASVGYIHFDDFRGFCGPRNALTAYVANRLRSIKSDIGFAIEWS